MSFPRGGFAVEAGAAAEEVVVSSLGSANFRAARDRAGSME